MSRRTDIIFGAAGKKKKKKLNLVEVSSGRD
jgi:hypothetical protein